MSLAFGSLLLICPILCLVQAVTIVSVTPPIDINVKQFEAEFYNEFQSFFETRETSSRLAEMKELFREKANIKLQDLPRATEPPTCLTCRALSYTFMQYNDTTNSDMDQLSRVALDLVSFLERKQSIKVFPDLMANFLPTINYILRNSSRIDADRICSIWFQHKSCGESEQVLNEFPVNYPIPQPLSESKGAQPPSGEDPLVVVHLSDFHFDPYYMPGSNAVCDEEVCCRANQGYPNNTNDAAGYWGDYHFCDSPWHVVVDIVERVKKEYKKIDFIYYTGDTVDHFAWKTSVQHNSASIRQMTNYLKQEFPNIPLYPVLGNHETHPENSISPSYVHGENVSTQWLFDLIYAEWASLLPRAKETLKTAGYYALEIRPKLRLIAINNNFCYHSNIWLLHSTDYYADQLHWFRNELAAAKEDGEKVHVISHIPANDLLCFRAWAREYRKIVEEFSDTIVAVFNGHSHEDELNVYYSERDPTKAFGISFNGGSGTTFGYVNPNFKVYSVDRKTYEVLDYETWHYNITEANLTPSQPPRWQKTYTFKDAYNLTDLSPKAMDGLVKRLAADKDLLKLYWERKVKFSDWMLREGCDEKCLREEFCSIVAMVHGDSRTCDSMYPK